MFGIAPRTRLRTTTVRSFAHARSAPRAAPDHIIPSWHCAPCFRHSRTFRQYIFRSFLSLAMSQRQRHCKTCGNTHSPPTGKHCSRKEDENDMLSILQSIKGDLSRLNDRVESIETERRDGSDEGATNNAKAAPDKDAVRSRLAELNLLSDDSAGLFRGQRRRKKAKAR